MKILCDVCWKEEASAFCPADEAALCQNCDVQVHRANKLAEKHPRFLLLHSQFQDSPLCDICQVKRALFFCREDRALLCKECEKSIHKANKHTKKHNRFLLTGVKLSAAAASFNVAASSSESGSETKINNSITSEINFLPNLMTNCSESSSNPSWQVEDLMDPSPHYGFRKVCSMFPCIRMVCYHHPSVRFLNLIRWSAFPDPKNKSRFPPGHFWLETSFIKFTHSNGWWPCLEHLPGLNSISTSISSSGDGYSYY